MLSVQVLSVPCVSNPVDAIDPCIIGAPERRVLLLPAAPCPVGPADPLGVLSPACEATQQSMRSSPLPLTVPQQLELTGTFVGGMYSRPSTDVVLYVSMAEWANFPIN
jgi:hypothetical protein